MKKYLPVLCLFLACQLKGQSLIPAKPPGKPRLNGAKTIGIRSGSTFNYTLPIVGERPLELEASGLPSGLRLNSATGVISGKVTKKGDYSATINIKNGKGKVEAAVRFVVGDQISLTPPMGWDGGDHLAVMDQKKLKEVQEAMMKYDLVNHGYNYIIIHDSWQGKRGGKHFGIMPDSSRYPEMKKTIDQLHHDGLRVGIYSSPWVRTSGNFIGSTADTLDGTSNKHDDHQKNHRIGKYPFFMQDTKQWSDWGISLLKFEWEPLDVRHARLISDELKKTHKDIVFWAAGNASYNEAPEWQRIANIWNTRGNSFINADSLQLISGEEEQWSPYTGPGHWANPGKLAVGLFTGDTLVKTPLSKEEQITQFTLWSLLSAPLLLQCDLSKLDDFTVNLITNDEVLDIDQDAQGIQARKVFAKDNTLALAKSLQDGSIAVGLFNKDGVGKKVAVSWADLGIVGARQVRNVWMQQDLGKFKDAFEVDVPAHGVVLVRIIKP